MKRVASLIALSMTFLSLHSSGDQGNPFPWVIPWNDATPSFTNLSQRLSAPAGEGGFIIAKGGHLANESGRVRFFGVNLCFGACFPTHKQADEIAGRMAKLGVNCVRFHHMDTFFAPEGLLKDDARSFDLEMVDRLDYFIAALKKRGIYTNLNLHVGRLYPGMPTWEGMPQYFKGVDQFYPSMIAMQKEFAHALLAHVNKYTGLAYKDEPAVALIEINNENSLIDQWWKGALDSLPEPYQSVFTERWKAWQAEHRDLLEAKEESHLSGEELLRGKAGEWAPETFNDAGIEMGGSPAGNGWSASILQTGAEPWHAQVNSGPLALRKGEPYTFSFEIAASTPRQISVALVQAAPPWRVLWSTEISAGPEPTRHTLVMSPAANVPTMRLSFNNLGAETGAVTLSSASLRAGAAHLLERPDATLKKSDFAAYPTAIQQGWIRFLWETEGAYWREMREFLRDEVKVRSLLVGTQVGFSPVGIQAEFDVIDAHGYWQHPIFPGKEWDPVHWSVNNIPMAGVEGGGALAPMATMRAIGKPFICTEYSHPAPNAYGSESLPLLAAYGAFQDWDGLFAFAYSHRRDDWDSQRLTGFFDLDQDPSKLVTIPAAVDLFVRGDVAPGREERSIAVSTARLQEEARFAGPELSTEQFGGARDEFLRHRVGLDIGGAAHGAVIATPFDSESAGGEEASVSDHGELKWEKGKEGKAGLVLINTEKTRGVIGYAEERSLPLGDITITPGVSLHGASVILVTELEPSSGFWLWKTPRRFLVSATGATRNLDMGWKNSAHTSVGSDWGKGPTQVEGIHASIAFKGKTTPKAWALDERGQRMSEIPVKNAILRLSPEYKTLWYEVEW